ncbi:opsin-VA-like isoform X3 [Pyxicephalus adspersus]|uniref:opsin-VA-like isoform X3 n=1 Tax=Pyxicephalus adspersus TaxID=30357 RepID=UPI003B597860
MPTNDSLQASPETSTEWSPFRGPLKSVEPWNFQLLTALMFLITTFSIVENFIVIIVTVKFKQLRQPLNYIIVNLSVADFLVSIVGGTISIATNSKGYFYLGPWACVVEGFAVTFFGIVALWSLSILAFERYSGRIEDHTYIITFLITCFVLPLMLIFVSYGKLMRKLRKVSDTQGRLGSTRKPEKEVTRMVVIMILAFLICWTPYAAFSILVTAHPTIELDPRLSAIPAFFAKTASMYNPIIYVFMNKQFRRCLLQMFHCHDLEPKESNMPTSERAVLNRNVGEMRAIAAHITSNRKTEEEQSSCNSFAQLPISENKVCPM